METYSGMVRTINKKKIVTYLAVIYVLIQSGSVYHYSYMGTLGIVNILVTSFVTLYYVMKKGKKAFRIQRNMVDIFAVCCGVGLLLCMIRWGEFSSVFGYIGKFCRILLPLLIVRYIRMDDFLDSYIKIIFFLALISLFSFLFPAILNIFPFRYVIDTSRWDYDNFLIYARYHNPIYDIHKRNIGVFWEPGMYQGFLIFAMLYVASTRKMNLKTIIYQFVMCATILTTQSSTGYVLLLMMALFIPVKVILPKRKDSRILMTFMIVTLAMILAFNPQLIFKLVDSFVPGATAKFAVDNSSTSMGTRYYGTLIDAYLVLRNPFGIGETQIEAFRNSIANQFNFIVGDANINTTFSMMLCYGCIPGILYFIMIVKGCFQFFGKNIIAFLGLLIFLVIINTEPHYLTLFFTIVFMYFAMYKQDAEHLKYNH